MAAGATSIGTGTTLTFANFTAELTSVTIDGPECGVVDVAHLALAAGSLRPKLACELLEPGTITAEGYFKGTEDPEDAVGTSTTLVILCGDGSTWTYAAAIMTNYSASLPLEEAQTCSATWQINGALTIT